MAKTKLRAGEKSEINFIDMGKTFMILGVASVGCYLITLFSSADTYISMLFVLSVFLTARFTNGYFYGILAAVISVLCVNYVFTYPYFEFNFILPGYPITIFTMLTVSIITSMMTSQIKRQERLKREAENEKMRANLLRAVSHDLRTPLTSIMGGCQTILENEELLSAEQRHSLLTDMKKDSEWLVRMVENLLSVTRIREGEKANLNKSMEAIEEIVSVSVSKYRKRFDKPEVIVSVPEEFILIPVDATLIEQVIVNLLENAALHAKGVSLVKLDVRLSGENVVFDITDNGEGISEEVLPHLFDEFIIHTSDAESDKTKNMGIGLSVCSTIVRAHDGLMTAKNLETGGAVFSFSIPYREKSSHNKAD